MFIAVGRENLDFDEFDESVKLSDKFKKTLHKFEDVDIKDSFFGTVLFGLLTKLSSNNENFMVEWAGEKLGEEFIEKLLSLKENLRLDDSFEKCHFVNELLEQKHLFLRVYKRRDKFRFLIKKGVVGRNKIVRDLFACVIRKFNVYEISSVKFKHK